MGTKALWRVCVVCGREFDVRERRNHCAVTCSPECSTKHNRQQTLANKQKRRGERAEEGEIGLVGVGKDQMVKVLVDPTPLDEGGYKPGSMLSKYQFTTAMHEGMMPEGMTVLCGNTQYRVVGRDWVKE